MPPRPRTSSIVDEQPLLNRPRQHIFAPNFSNEDEADLIIRSSQGTSFLVKKICLQANSTVFGDMLAVGNNVPAGPGAQHLPVVDVSEEDCHLELFLRHLVPSRYLINDLPPIPTDFKLKHSSLDGLFTAFDKYRCYPLSTSQLVYTFRSTQNEEHACQLSL